MNKTFFNIQAEIFWVSNYVKELCRQFPVPAHQWDHFDRVRRCSLHIGKKLNADLNVLEIASLLHDIGRLGNPSVKNGSSHAERGAAQAEIILDRRGFSQDIIYAISHCIRAHSFTSTILPETIESQIVQDADRLDALGAIGIIRVATHDALHELYEPLDPLAESRALSSSYTLDHFSIKILKIKDMLNTDFAKQIAAVKHDFIITFLNQFKREVQIELTF